jgi:hypothetical protein
MQRWGAMCLAAMQEEPLVINTRGQVQETSDWHSHFRSRHRST